jgi:hypothetical protein
MHKHKCFRQREATLLTYGEDLSLQEDVVAWMKANNVHLTFSNVGGRSYGRGDDTGVPIVVYTFEDTEQAFLFRLKWL